MASSCVTFPTSTQTDSVVTQGLSIGLTSSISTSPPTVTTIVTRGCTNTLSQSGTCIPSDISVTSTIPGELTTVQIPFTLTFDITSARTTTLFGSSCSQINTPSDTPSPSSTPTPPPVSVFTPPPTIITSESSSTQADGSVVVQTITTTSIQPATSVVAPSATLPPNQNNNSSTSLGPIIGGAVGGFFGLIGIVALIWFIVKRRRRWDDIFDKDDDDIFGAGAGSRRNDRFSLDVDVEPKPYQYGLVGHAAAPGPVSPPSSPPISAVGAKSYNTSQSQHGRHRSSLTPLNLPMSASTPGPSVTTISSRPSTAGSMMPLRPPSQQGYPQQQQQRQGDVPNSSSTSHAHSQSNGSFTLPPLSLNQTTSPGPGYNAFSSVMGTGTGDDHSYFNRSGSPTSIQEQPVRRLQVANALPLSPASDRFSFAESLPSPPAGAAVATALPQRDGKGRLRTSASPPPLVHLDGGRLQQENEGSSSGSRGPGAGDGPLPPAYEA